jgi:hypothetical protein
MVRIFAILALMALTAPAALAQSPKTEAILTSATCPGTGCATLSVAGLGGVGIQVNGTFTGTVQFEASIDGRVYTALDVLPITGTQTAVSSTTAAGLWAGQVSGLSIVRARVSAYTSGYINVTLQGAPARGR